MKCLTIICRPLLFSAGLLLIGQATFAQPFQNLDFQQLCDAAKTGFCHWDLSWGGERAVQPDTLDGQTVLRISGPKETSVGFTEQIAAYHADQGLSILTLTAFVKSDQIKGKGAGLNIGLYDGEGQLIGTKDMGGFYSLDWIQGTTPWKQYTISIVCPVATTTIKIGAILFGQGDAYFKDYEVTISPIAGRAPSPMAVEYLSTVCDTIARHSLVRDSIDLENLKNTALAIAGDADTYADCYLAINYLLAALRPYGDEHSFLMTAAEMENWEQDGSQVSKLSYPELALIDNCGYILVPPFHGGNQEQILAFADSLQRGIKKLYESGIKGWIVDLRQNTGGNMAPMVAGLGPLFSEERLGALVDVNGQPNSWYYRAGAYLWDDEPGWTVSDPVQLEKKLPIAVLTSGQTGSSGEIVVVSFIGNDQTRLFGQATWGLTTGNGDFELPDGARIFLASTIYSDRNGNQFHGPIVPDVLIESDPKAAQDSVMTAAVKWIHRY